MDLDLHYFIFSLLVFVACFFAMRVNTEKNTKQNAKQNAKQNGGPMSEGCLIFLIAAGILGYRFNFSLPDHVFNLVVNIGIISISLLFFKHCREIAIKGGFQTLVIFSLIISFFHMAFLQLLKKLIS